MKFGSMHHWFLTQYGYFLEKSDDIDGAMAMYERVYRTLYFGSPSAAFARDRLKALEKEHGKRNGSK